jgi:hypothetical protein
MLVFLLVVVALFSGFAGYGIAVVTAEPVMSALFERQRVAQEAKLAQLRLHHATHTAMQRLLAEARGPVDRTA